MDFIFEPKLDGFRAIAYVENGACQQAYRAPELETFISSPF
jgi:hypothetical protein